MFIHYDSISLGLLSFFDGVNVMPLMEQSKEESASVNITVFEPNNSPRPLLITKQHQSTFLEIRTPTTM